MSQWERDVLKVMCACTVGEANAKVEAGRLLGLRPAGAAD